MHIPPFYPAVEIPDVSLTEFILERAKQFGDKPAFIDGPTGRSISFSELGDQIGRVAGALRERGFGKGDVAAIYSPNVMEYAIVFHAAATLGGAVTTANPLYTAEELKFQLTDASASVLFTIGMFLDKANEAVEGTGVKEIITFDGAEGTTPYATLLNSDPVTQEPVDPGEDIVVLPYSSGTTGLPKGVMLTHTNLVANLLQTAAATDCRQMTEEDTLIAVLPFFHIYGMVVIMNFGLYQGCTTVVVPRFDMEEFLGLVSDHGVTVAHLVPPIVLGLAKHPAVDNYDLSKLDLIFCGAARSAKACFGSMPAFGLRVTTRVRTHRNQPGYPSGSNYWRQSEPCWFYWVNISNTEARIIDLDTEEEVTPGQTGELLVRGPQVMKGYLNNPQATAHTVDSEGWLHTGDIAFVDDAGHTYIVDRVKELIKYKGMQVAPAELEALLLTHPSVADVAVIPSPDDEAGEVPKAFVVKKADVSSDDLLSFVADNVAPHKKVRRLEFVDAVPSRHLAILRRLLVAEEREKIAGGS